MILCNMEGRRKRYTPEDGAVERQDPTQLNAVERKFAKYWVRGDYKTQAACLAAAKGDKKIENKHRCGATEMIRRPRVKAYITRLLEKADFGKEQRALKLVEIGSGKYLRKKEVKDGEGNVVRVEVETPSAREALEAIEKCDRMEEREEKKAERLSEWGSKVFDKYFKNTIKGEAVEVKDESNGISQGTESPREKEESSSGFAEELFRELDGDETPTEEIGVSVGSEAIEVNDG